MRSIGSGGETLGTELLEWGRSVFGLTVNEFYGQTECNLVVGNCSTIMPVMPGSMGKPIPGHEIAIVDPARQHFYQPLWTLVGGAVFPREASMRAMEDVIPRA